jgi:hypothetical protein
MAVFLIVAYVYSSTKLGKGQNRFYLEVEWGLRGGAGGRGRNGPNNVCTYE